MYIHLGTNDASLIQAVYARIKADYPEEPILISPEDIFSHEYRPGLGTHILSSGDLPVFDDIALERWYHLYLASRGARFWVEPTSPPVSTPTYAGVLVDIDKVVIDAIFAENRAIIFQTSGVNYVGRTYGDPRTAILVDYKGDKTHNPTNDGYIKNILTALPDNVGQSSEPHYWGNFAIISTSNVDKLAPFIEDLSETDMLAYSPGAIAKLKSIGRDFGKIGTPKPEKSYGLAVRETASRMHPEF
jgi:hypothetical protein